MTDLPATLSCRLMVPSREWDFRTMALMSRRLSKSLSFVH